MRQAYKNIIIALYLFLIPYAGYSQPYENYNLNINAGLPSDHVYYLMKDRHGYLWMGTENGVVKYNGYDSKIFDISCGMANSDVWTLFEDTKGKIWLSAISNQLGYLYNGKYKSVYVSGKTSRIYPEKMFEFEGSISFINHAAPGSGFEIYNIKNDTLRIDCIKTIPYIRPFMNYHKDVYAAIDNSIYKIFSNNKVKIEKICTYDLGYQNDRSITYISFFNDNIFMFSDKIASYVNIHDTGIRKIIFNGNNKEYIFNSFYDSNKLFICTNSHIYEINKKLQIENILSIEEMISTRKSHQLSVTYFLDDDFWGKCMSTNTKGLYLNFYKTNFTSLNIDLQNYYYIGSYSTNHYWWNKTDKTLACINKDGKVSYQKIEDAYSLKSIIPYNKNYAIISSLGYFYILNGKKNKIKNTIQIKNWNSDDPIKTILYNIVAIDSDHLYAIGIGSGFCKLTQGKNNIIYKPIDTYPYKGLLFDSFRHTVWLYDNQKIVAYKDEKKIFTADDTMLNTLGIKKIEKLLIDPHNGNIFIKDIDKIFVFNLKTFLYTEIFKNFRLQKALCFLQNNTFIVAGKFGVSFCKITGENTISEPIIKRNVKGLSYSYISDAQTTASSVLLNTDKGMYSVNIPTDSELYANKYNYSSLPYKLITNYHDSIIDTKNGDTIFIDQSDNKLLFDIINPLGNGTVKYSYRIASYNKRWEILNAHELYLPHLKPDNYYTLSLIANDDVWKSSRTDIHLYIVPYWWQTVIGKRICYLSLFILTGVLILSIIYTTRKIVIRKQAKKNLQLEVKNLHLALELKSIHAQINPHFIFNTLSSGLYFIKKGMMKEAYKHISAFSDLLRVYIKSSREKYITIADEIANLTNYIGLQQSRFENKFDYTIIIPDNVAIDKIKIPSLLLQPIVENAIIHGLYHKEEKGCLKIEFKIDTLKNEVICIIDDDGIGREQSKLYNEESSVKAQSYGSDLINELINVFNNYEQTNIEIRYTDKMPPQTGTTVILTIKNPPHER